MMTNWRKKMPTPILRLPEPRCFSACLRRSPLYAPDPETQQQHLPYIRILPPGNPVADILSPPQLSVCPDPQIVMLCRDRSQFPFGIPDKIFRYHGVLGKSPPNIRWSYYQIGYHGKPGGCIPDNSFH